MTGDAKAWGDFWANNLTGDGNGCLPDRWSGIEDAQRKAWSDFIHSVPQEAAILDLATGDGRVLRWMHEERDDLVLTGIDLAPQLPPAPEGTQTHGGVAMEQLPFEAGQFDGVVSQFGFEYGDVGKVAAEIARVLRAGGMVGLMVHRGDGPILEHNLERKTQIEWVLGEADVVGAVTQALETPSAGAEVAAQVAALVARLGASKYGQASPAWEIPEALRRACVMGAEQGAGSIVQTVSAVNDQASNELGRIDSLTRACAAADNRDELLRQFHQLGFLLVSTKTVSEPSGRALADFLTFRLPD